jgi:hypothetical protein
MPSPVTITSLSVPARPRVEALLSRIDPVRGRLVFALDATASRQPTWDTAAQLQADMFQAVAAIGGLDVQLVYYRRFECQASHWLSDAARLGRMMARISCQSGFTQIGNVLTHARKENELQKVHALVFVGDAVEEKPSSLYAIARELNVPAFLFLEGDDKHAAQVFGEIAKVTGGATSTFNAGAGQRLADLLKAVAAFATGGVKALASQQTEAARLLLTQIRK